MSERVILDVDLTPPPPSDGLSMLVGRAVPVRLRRPANEALWAGAGLTIWMIAVVLMIGTRSDLPRLPAARWTIGASMWLLVLLGSLLAALRPATGQVLPSVRIARGAALGLPILAALAAILFLVDAPGLTYHPDHSDEMSRIVHCLSIGLGVAFLPLIAVLWSARGRMIVGRPWLAAAIGAGAGALGAFVLHVVCPIGGVWHVLAGHAGVVVAGALLAAATMRVVPQR